MTDHEILAIAICFMAYATVWEKAYWTTIVLVIIALGVVELGRRTG